MFQAAHWNAEIIGDASKLRMATESSVGVLWYVFKSVIIGSSEAEMLLKKDFLKIKSPNNEISMYS